MSDETTCDVCGSPMPVVGYTTDAVCPRCDSLYSYDESAELRLDSGQLWAVKVYSLIRQYCRRLIAPFRPDSPGHVETDASTLDPSCRYSFDQSQFTASEGWLDHPDIHPDRIYGLPSDHPIVQQALKRRQSPSDPK